MSQKTETDLRELKELIQGLDKKIDLGFNTLEGKIDRLDTRMTLVESAITKLENRLWTFGGIVLRNEDLIIYNFALVAICASLLG